LILLFPLNLSVIRPIINIFLYGGDIRIMVLLILSFAPFFKKPKIKTRSLENAQEFNLVYG